MPGIRPVSMLKLIEFLVNMVVDRHDAERTENKGE